MIYISLNIYVIIVYICIIYEYIKSTLKKFSVLTEHGTRKALKYHLSIYIKVSFLFGT